MHWENTLFLITALSFLLLVTGFILVGKKNEGYTVTYIGLIVFALAFYLCYLVDHAPTDKKWMAIIAVLVSMGTSLWLMWKDSQLERPNKVKRDTEKAWQKILQDPEVQRRNALRARHKELQKELWGSGPKRPGLEKEYQEVEYEIAKFDKPIQWPDNLFEKSSQKEQEAKKMKNDKPQFVNESLERAEHDVYLDAREDGGLVVVSSSKPMRRVQIFIKNGKNMIFGYKIDEDEK